MPTCSTGLSGQGTQWYRLGIADFKLPVVIRKGMRTPMAFADSNAPP